MRLIDLFWKNERGTMVADIAKAAAAIGFISVVAANFVSSQTAHLDKERLTEIASAASKGRPIDPLVTGSILKRADQTRLDPCAIPR
jgi:hypothetical protein